MLIPLRWLFYQSTPVQPALPALPLALTWEYDYGGGVDPLGGSAVTLTPPAGAGWHETESQRFQVTTGVRQAYTVKIKRGAGALNAAVWVYGSMPLVPDPYAYILVDLATGGVLFTSASNATLHSYSVARASDGWVTVSCDVTFTVAWSSGGYYSVYVDATAAIDGSNGTDGQYTADGTSSILVKDGVVASWPPAATSATGVPRRERWSARIRGRTVIGSKEEVIAQLRKAAAEDAREVVDQVEGQSNRQIRKSARRIARYSVSDAMVFEAGGVAKMLADIQADAAQEMAAASDRAKIAAELSKVYQREFERAMVAEAQIRAAEDQEDIEDIAEILELL